MSRHLLQGWIVFCKSPVIAPVWYLLTFVCVKVCTCTWKGFCELACAMCQILCVCVSVYMCVFPGGGKRGQFAAGDQRMKWRKREGNDEGLLSQNCHSPFVFLYGNLDTHIHTHIACCCCDCDENWYTGFETQDGKHCTWRIEWERKRPETERDRERGEKLQRN